MRQKDTNLPAIIDIAIDFLYLPITTDPQFPTIAKHPFTDSIIIGMPDKKGKLTAVNLSEKDALAQWEKSMEDWIRKTENPIFLMARISKSYRLAFLKYTEKYMSAQTLGKMLRDAWQTSEFPGSDPNLSQKQLCKLFRESDKSSLMSSEELYNYEKLPETLRVWRGVRSEKKQDIYGMSWTLNIEQAQWFANRFGQQGKVYTTEIQKENILACINIGGEHEIIVDSSKLKNVVEDK